MPIMFTLIDGKTWLSVHSRKNSACSRNIAEACGTLGVANSTDIPPESLAAAILKDETPTLVLTP